ncbi:hypothetical protein [Trinickia symbiotica]|uniref:hypothetical protein n=1 Tax=Trinickia symbiotica TaxID=863227 RepID=UPI0011AF0639|nr:hypothetical protein [Trinickia symbiotica]
MKTGEQRNNPALPNSAECKYLFAHIAIAIHAIKYSSSRNGARSARKPCRARASAEVPASRHALRDNWMLCFRHTRKPFAYAARDGLVTIIEGQEIQDCGARG